VCKFVKFLNSSGSVVSHKVFPYIVCKVFKLQISGGKEVKFVDPHISIYVTLVQPDIAEGKVVSLLFIAVKLVNLVRFHISVGREVK
jgi:hypothetical protein